MGAKEVIFSVAEFNEVVGLHLDLLGEVVVEGEISELKVSQNKWIYLTLKDEAASLSVFATVFQIRNLRELSVGMKVRVWGRPSLYQKTARFSLNAREIVPAGEGALRLAYERLRQMLAKEGLFDPERKRPLPRFPETIGLITAKGSQAYNDFVKVVGERMGGLKIYFYPAQVQGKEAVESLIKGLSFFNEIMAVDVVVITRGGGSLEDLAAFNDERVVRAVFASQTPTICAIGHEGDVSLVELAADLRASTPSNAAELVVRDRREVVKEVSWWQERLEMSFVHTLERWSDRVERLIKTMRLRFELVGREVEKLIWSLAQVEEKIKNRIQLYKVRIKNMEERMINLSPERVLARGFSLVQTSAGDLVRSVSEVALGQDIVTIMSDGRIKSRISWKEESK